MSESQLMQMPAPETSSFIGPAPSLNYHPIHEYRCPNELEVNSKQNITPHTNVWMRITKITRQTDGRMESQMVCSKITCQTDGRMES